MGDLFLLIAVVETIFIVLFANYNHIQDLNLQIMYTNYNFSISFFVFCLILYLLGILAGILIMFKGYLSGAKQINSVKRKLEKTSVDADDSELKIKTLENKIKMLEVALDKALKK